MADAVVLTQDGEEWIVDLMAAVSAYGTWGTGVAEAAKTDTDMGTESGENRVECTITQPLADKIQYVWQITASDVRAITEAGIFSAATEGVLYFHASFSVINLASGDKIEFTLQDEIT